MEYEKFFLEVLATKKPGPLDKVYDLEWEAEQSYLTALSGVQDAFSFRTLSRARKISRHLIEEQGDLRIDRFPLYFDSSLDQKGAAHVERVLGYFQRHPDALNRFRAPVCNEQVRILICDSLAIPVKSVIDHAEVRQAVLSALLCPLRQSVGSCFATAPAIHIQAEQIERVLDDFFELLVLGKLRRTFGGVQYSVPLNATWGIGDLKKPITEAISYSPPLREVFGGKVPKAKCRNVQELLRESLPEEEAGRAESIFKAHVDHALLKSWEYTIASFSDYKTEFTKWNLFASLGFDHAEEGGIGQVVYQALDVKLNEWNDKLQELELEHNIAVDRVRMSQSMLSQASDKDRIRRFKTELSLNLHQLDTVREMIEETHDMAKNMAGFFKFLVEFFQEKFQQHFQEVYDAQMHEVEEETYDDSPAGFRLVFKHGRDDPSLWTLIYDEKDFVKSLVEFFLLIEGDAIHTCEWEKGKDGVSWVFGVIIQHIREPLFLETAFKRMKKAHKKVPGVESRTPWSYIAGGSMNSLLRGYYCIEGAVTEEARPVESATDLCIFLVELFKEAAPDLTQPFIDHPEKGLLMFTPTHACIIRPGMPFFKSAWMDSSFTYTWVRDRLIDAARLFYMSFSLTEREQEHLLTLWGIDNVKPEVFSQTPHELRMQVAKEVSSQKLDEIDGFLRFSFPIYRREEWRAEASLALKKLLKGDRLLEAEKFMESIAISTPFITHNDFIDILKMAVLQTSKSRVEKIDVEGLLREKMPPFMEFADTNWSHYNFAFGYNPGCDTLDLWRVHQNQREGKPMSVWRPYYDGSLRKPWGVLIRPFEYGGFYTRVSDLPRYKI